MKLVFKIPAYILGFILVIILAGAYLYYFTTLPESELNNWISAMISSGEEMDINVHRINRDLWNRLVFEGVNITPRKPGKTPVVSISRMELDYDLMTLIKSRTFYNSLVIDSISVEMPSKIEIADSVSAPREFSLPLESSIKRIFVNSIEITLASREKLLLQGLAFSASAKKDGVEIKLDNLSGKWPARDLDVYSVSGKLVYNTGGWHIQGVDIETSRSSARLEGQLGSDMVNDMAINYEFNPIDLTDIRNLTGVKIRGTLFARGNLKGSIKNFGGDISVDGLFFERRFDNVNLAYEYSDMAIKFNSIEGDVFEAFFKGRGALDFSARPELFSYSGTVEHLDLRNIGPDIATEFSGLVEMTGEGLGENSFNMNVSCDLDSVILEDYFFNEVTGPVKFDLRHLEFLDGFSARYKNTVLEGTGKLVYAGDIDVTGEVEFSDLTDFTDQMFLKKLGGRGNAEFYLTGPATDFSVDASFYSDSCWTYGLEPGIINLQADLKSFISHRVGAVSGRWLGGELYSIPTDTGYFETSVSGERVFIDTVFVNGLGGGLWFNGDYDGTMIPPIFKVDTLWAEIYGNHLYTEEPLLFNLYDQETEFKRFNIRYGRGIISLTGDVTTDLDLNLDLNASGFQIQSILDRLYPSRKIEGVWSGNAELRGNFEDPLINSAMAIDSVKVDNVFLGNMNLKSDYADGSLSIQDGTLVSPVAEYRFSGNLPMDLRFEEVENRFPERPIDLRLSADGGHLVLGEVFISTIERFVTDFDFDFTFKGTYRKPLVLGEGKIYSGSLKLLELETPLDSVSATIIMENETIRIVDARATVSEKQTGFDRIFKDLLSGVNTKEQPPLIQAEGTLKLISLGEFLYDVDVTGRNFYFISDQFDIRGIGDFDLKVTGLTPPTVSGDIVITKLDIREEFDSFYDPEYDLADAAIEDSTLWNLDLDISGQNNIWIKNSEIDAELKADLHVNRNVGLYDFLGTLEVNRGNYYLVSQKFRFESGIMTYQEVASIDPEIDFLVSTRLRGSDSEAPITIIDLNITGTLFEPAINTTSASGLSREDVLRLLLERNLVASGGTQNLLENARVLIKYMGVDPFTAQGIVEEIEIGTDERNQEKTGFSIAKYLSPDLYVRVSGRLSWEDPGGMIGVEYYLSDNFFLKASQGQQSSDYEGTSFDINFNIEF